MPSPIDTLRAELATSLRALNLPTTSFGTPDIMARMVEKLRGRFGNGSGTIPPDRICAAIHKLRTQRASILTAREFYFTCWGLCQACNDNSPLLEDQRPWRAFFKETQRRQLSSRAWRGLLDAYFRYGPTDPQSANGKVGLRHRQQLRELLREDCPRLMRRQNNVRWEWMEILNNHPQLLGDDPCAKLAAGALAGDRRHIDELERGLGIPETSWFWPELVLSQVEKAVGYATDARFKGYLDTLIAQLGNHPLILSEGLARLLSRYAECVDNSPHEGLKAFAVDQWGNPHLTRQAQWGHVKPKIKEMVSQWLVLEDLQDFFELLQSDRAADNRRLGFWRLYIKQISYSHIVLGRDIWFSQDTDWKEFQQKKKGRISRLDGGTTTNNAFIMRIGGYFFVEFGEIGNACYGYSEGNEPFNLGSGVLCFPSELKDKHSNIFRETHMDGHRNWEYKFAQRLSNLGISPD
jgi:hypothetical protein